MRRSICLFSCGFLSISIALLPITGDAVFPIAALGKEILQNIIFGQVKDQMIGSLANMGCKGARLAGVIASASAGKNFGGGGLPGGLPGGMPPGFPPGMPGGANVPGQGFAMPNGTGMPPVGGKSMRAARAGGIPTATPEQAEAMMRNGMPDVATVLSQMPGGSEMSPEQAAQVQQAMAEVQNAMSHPLSRAETLQVFDEMASLGLMTDEMRSEARDCITLGPPGSDNAVGTTGAMMKNMVLPRLRDTKARLAELTPEEQNQLADGLVDALKQASPQDRKAFLDGVGIGFFPAPVMETVRAKIAKR